MTHAFPAAVAARDAEALIDTLAPDVTLHSAVTKVPFEGREVVADTYRSVLESFDELRIVDEFERGDTLAFFWGAAWAAVRGRRRPGRASTPTARCSEITVRGGRMSGGRHLPRRDRVRLAPSAPGRAGRRSCFA